MGVRVAAECRRGHQLAQGDAGDIALAIDRPGAVPFELACPLGHHVQVAMAQHAYGVGCGYQRFVGNVLAQAAFRHRAALMPGVAGGHGVTQRQQ